MRHDSFIMVMTIMNESCPMTKFMPIVESCLCVSVCMGVGVGGCGCTGWRRLLGCLKLQVIFRKRATNYRALLRRMTYEDKA